MTDKQTPDPHAALIAEAAEYHSLDRMAIYGLAGRLRDALVLEKARADVAERALTDREDYP